MADEPIVDGLVRIRRWIRGERDDAGQLVPLRDGDLVALDKAIDTFQEVLKERDDLRAKVAMWYDRAIRP